MNLGDAPETQGETEESGDAQKQKVLKMCMGKILQTLLNKPRN